MTALQLISTLNQILFIGLFVVVLRRAVRQPTRAHVDTALLFGSIAGVVTLARIVDWVGISGTPAVTALTLVLLNVAPFAMLRLVEDFRGTPRWVQVAGAAAFIGVSMLSVLAFPSMPQLVELATIAFFAAVGGYAAIAFATEARSTRGITQRRMTAVAIGAATFIGAVVTIFIGALLPAAEALGLVAQLAALVAVVAFFTGFAPPSWIRRAWREPDLRRFLERSVHLAGVPDDRTALIELQQAAAAAFGATGASVGLADTERGVIAYASAAGGWVEYPSNAFIAGRAFTEQRRQVTLDAAQDDPDHAAAYVGAGARTVIAAPITTEDRRIGVLSVYAEREPIFVEDDLWLLELLADQAAVLLEARTLTAHASELRSREDAAHLKEEFLSAAAHDLRTPLTVVLGQAELLERRLARDPAARIDAASVARIVREARRLRDLISELLDAQRLEQGRAIGDLVPADLLGVVEGVRDRHAASGTRVAVEEADAPVVVAIDRARIEQVLENLVDNAMKYGQPGQPPLVRVDRGPDEATVSVVDRGMGIPDGERGRIFERFFRASNAQSVTDTGLGLGLYICRRIVEEHGGRIWHEPTPGGGSTFAFSLPLVAPETNAAPTPREEPAWGSQLEPGVADA